MIRLNKMLYWLSGYCRCRIIEGPDHRPYLERYHLLRLAFGYQLYLHRFVASDPGRGLHNHPWPHAVSLVLCGRYRETRMLGAQANNRLEHRQLRGGKFNFISGNLFHRVDIPAGQECWSLFLHAGKAKTWGFIQHQAYYDHNDIVKQPSNPLWWKQAQRPIQCPQMRLPLT